MLTQKETGIFYMALADRTGSLYLIFSENYMKPTHNGACKHDWESVGESQLFCQVYWPQIISVPVHSVLISQKKQF